MCQDSEYSRILNGRVLNIHCCTWLTYFHMTGFCIKKQIWKGSEYASIQNISAYASITQGFEYARIWLNNGSINCSDNGKFFNMNSQNFTGF